MSGGGHFHTSILSLTQEERLVNFFLAIAAVL